MAAAAAGSAKNMVGGSDDSSSDSSDDDETRRRCREAVWETRAVAHKEEDDTVKQSKRFVVAEHEHDGNELQVTQGFRTHVAKKLGHLLDSYISETQIKNSPSVESAGCDGDDDEEGFRLFSTSVPGQTTEELPAPVRRRPVWSSSDSDSEMETRLREAAVSVKDLLPSLTLPSTTPPPSSEPPCSGQVKQKEMIAEGEEGHGVKKKKKKKRRQSPEESAQVDCSRCPVKAQSNGEHGNVEQEQFKAKRKKKKKREGNTMDEALS